MSFYQRLKDLREDKDMKQKDIANIINTSPNYYGDYESGKREITLSRMITLANFYNVSMDYITGRTNDKRGLTRSELSDEETEIIRKYRLLSDKSKGRILGQIDMLIDDEADNRRDAV